MLNPSPMIFVFIVFMYLFSLICILRGTVNEKLPQQLIFPKFSVMALTILHILLVRGKNYRSCLDSKEAS